MIQEGGVVEEEISPTVLWRERKIIKTGWSMEREFENGSLHTEK